MISNLFEKLKLNWIEILLFVYLLTVGLFRSAHGILLFVILYGLWHFGRRWSASDKEQKYLILSFALLAIVAILSTLFVTESDTAYRKLEKYLMFVWAIPFFLAMLPSVEIKKVLKLSIPIAAILMGIAALYSTYVMDQPRSMFYTRNYLFFGYLSAVFSVFSFIYWINADKQRWFYFVGSIMGVIACILSGTRGALVGWFMGMVVLLFLPGIMNTKIRGLIILSVVLVISAVMLNTGYMARVNTAYRTLQHDAKGQYSDTSAGERLQMWSAAWNIFKRRPLLGAGMDGYRLEIRKMLEKGEVDKILTKYNHPHNIYLSVLANLGLVGFVPLILVFLVPLRFFYRSMNLKYTRPYSIMGVAFVVMYGVFGLTEAIFEIQAITAFYVFMIPMLYVAIRNSEPSGNESDKSSLVGRSAA